MESVSGCFAICVLIFRKLFLVLKELSVSIVQKQWKYTVIKP